MTGGSKMQIDEIWDLLLNSKDWNKLRFALYCRVSSDDQKKYGVSMEIQEKRLIALMEEMKVIHYKIFKGDEGKSATSIKNRHNYNHIINHLDDLDVILATKLNRWSRNPSDLLYCLQALKSTVLYTLDEQYDYRESTDWPPMMIISVEPMLASSGI